MIFIQERNRLKKVSFNNNKFISNENLRILFSSFLNLIMKMTIVYIVLDVYKYDPEKSYYLILISVLIFSFISNLKIGFRKQFKLNYLIKWLFIMITLLILENIIFLYFENLFNLKTILSLLLSIIFYLIRFLSQKYFIFK